MLPHKPINIRAWVDENRHLLRPPIGNQQLYHLNKEFIVMVVGGPNERMDFHLNDGEEIFFQVEGDILVRLIVDGEVEEVEVKEGDIFLLPAGVPHQPIRPEGTVGLVIERYRQKEEQDGFLWYCDNCGEKLHEVFIPIDNIVEQLPAVTRAFAEDVDMRTCKHCGHIKHLADPNASQVVRVKKG